tara:strand:- start:344 stop:856 length:513 start_codon:yes stop_codon:yes gene_type:complete
MAQENVVDPVFKKILLAETAQGNNKVFRKKLKEVDQRFYLLLEDYKRYYIAHNLDKESSDLESAFLREKSMLQDNTKDMFLLKNSVQSSLEKERKIVNDLEKVLRKERQQLKKNTFKEEKLQDLDAAAVQMLDDKNVAYNRRLVTIFNVVIGIIATGVLIYKVPRGEHIL